jgi:hypothetical protein
MTAKSLTLEFSVMVMPALRRERLAVIARLDQVIQ